MDTANDRMLLSTPKQPMRQLHYGLLSPDTPTLPADAYMSSDDSEASTNIQDEMDVEFHSPSNRAVQKHSRISLYSGANVSRPELESPSTTKFHDSDVVMSSVEPEEPNASSQSEFWTGHESSDENSSPQILRRSTRVAIQTTENAINLSAKREVNKGVRVAKTVARKAINLIAKREFSEEAPGTESPKAVTALVPFDGLPTVHSIDWQLMYPPGGSTHAAYPYPSMDPLLFFHPLWVPVTDGFPEISKVPTLPLPLGFKHVTWSGLLPIVFDPHQQAFKLTPNGPLPLNHEELQQNGLHEYVPGGKYHPESAMLPRMMAFSDGSDGEVYNWDNVDMTLPWIWTEKFYPSSDAHTDNPAYYGSTTVPRSALVLWRESRDCPDQVYDLEDGWRWMAEKEQNPTIDFVPSKAKSWAGVRRSYRKFKDPIPIQMMVTRNDMMENKDSDANFSMLVNQDRTTNKNAFCPYKSVATPECVDITLLQDTEFTLMELLSYFPDHFHWYNAVQRLEQASVTPSVIRNMINMTRGLCGDVAPKITTIRSAENVAKKRHLNAVEKSGEESGKAAVITSYTAENWEYDASDTYDYPLLALGHGLVELPSGEDAGPVTKLISWCRTQTKYEVLLSDVPKLLEEAGILPFIEPSDTGCPDLDFVSRHQKAVKKDRARVKASLKDN